MRRLTAAACTALLSATALAAGAAEAAAARAATAPAGVSFHVLGGFHLKRVENDGKTSTALLLCSSSTFGNGPATIHGVGNLKDATSACEQLNAVNGDFGTLNVHPAWLAPTVMAQVHVEAAGTWKGTKVEFKHDFQNDGMLAKQTGDVFAL